MSFGHSLRSFAVRCGPRICSRATGERIAIVARGIDGEHAMLLAERLRAIVGNHSFGLGRDFQRITVSIGVAMLAECGPHGGTLTEFIRLADDRLYMAKGRGRERPVGP